MKNLWRALKQMWKPDQEVHIMCSDPIEEPNVLTAENTSPQLTDEMIEELHQKDAKVILFVSQEIKNLLNRFGCQIKHRLVVIDGNPTESSFLVAKKS